MKTPPLSFGVQSASVPSEAPMDRTQGLTLAQLPISMGRDMKGTGVLGLAAAEIVQSQLGDQTSSSALVEFAAAMNRSLFQT